METLTPIERAVLGTTAHGPENLEQIYQHLHAAPAAIPLDEAADAVWSLVEKGLLTPRAAGDEPLPDVPHRVWKARFEPTPRGREIIKEDRPEPPPGWPAGRVYLGMFKGLIPDISAEEIDEARREMWGRLPEGLPLMDGVVSDTHATIWFLNDSPALSASARAAMVGAVQAGGSIIVASITLVEVAYLIEKARIDPTTFDQIMQALANPASGLVLAPLDLPVAETLRSVPRVDVPDMPDRIIAATALHLGLPLVSRDRKIQASAIQTIW